MEKSISDKSKESSEMVKTQVEVFDKKMSFINEKISSLTNKIIGGIKIEEKINTLFSAREKLLDETTTNRIKISILEKEFRDSINRIDGIIKESVLYPAVIGIKGKFPNFHGFIDFVLSESNINNNFREKNIMDLSSYKLKIEKALQTLGFKVESILSSCNSFTLSKIKESQEKFDYTIGLYKEKLNDVRIENSNYVIQLEKDTKDLRDETNIVKSMKSDIFSKVDTDVQKMKNDNLNIIETFNTYKEDFKKMNENISNLEKSIENLMLQKIKILFEGQKQINDSITKIKEEYDDILNNKIKNIINDQMKNFIKEYKEYNSKEINNNNNSNNTTLYKNGVNSVDNANTKDNNNVLNIKNGRKLSKFSINKKNNSSKNLLNNQDLGNNKQSLLNFSKNTSSINSPKNINGNENEKKIIRNNFHGKTIHNDIVIKKNIIDNLNNNKVNYSNILNNKINDNILLNLKNDNDNELDFNDYIKILNFKNIKGFKRRRSFDKTKNENFDKFQKLVKFAAKNYKLSNLLNIDTILLFEALQDYYEKDDELSRISELGDNLLETYIRENKKDEKDIRNYCKKKRIELSKIFVDNIEEILKEKFLFDVIISLTEELSLNICNVLFLIFTFLFLN